MHVNKLNFKINTIYLSGKLADLKIINSKLIISNLRVKMYHFKHDSVSIPSIRQKKNTDASL